MDAQRTPEILSTQAENELICERLLGWIKHEYRGDSPSWEVPSTAGEFRPTIFQTPSFTTWAEAGLILDALHAQKLGHYIDRLYEGGYRAFIDKVNRDFIAETGPAAIRAAALEYVKAVKS